MIRPGGYAVLFNPEPGYVRLDEDSSRSEYRCEGIVEMDTFRCGHCGSIRHVRVKERPEDIGGFCRQCMKAICPYCLQSGRCDPLEKKLERIEERARILRSYGL